MRVHNFGAGPAALPLAALERAQRELVDFENTGMSIMEHSHRGDAYDRVHSEATALLRALLGLGDDHTVMFLTGGASQHFAQIPMNFLHPGQSADYIVTGGWSEKALEEAQRVGTARSAASTLENGRYTRIPSAEEISIDPAAAYVHVTSNNTLYGTQWHREIDAKGRPLISDMSSDFLWKPTDLSPYDFVYAGAQKNLGPSGVLIAIARDSFVAQGRKDIPTVLRYATQSKARSLYNTPPTFAIYMVRNVLAWLTDLGGLAAIEKINREKSRRLYAALDSQGDFYRAPAALDSRSTMNVVWRLPTEALEEELVTKATAEGLIGLRGHRSVGGLRASIYNAVTLESVDALVDFLKQFARAHHA
ncbi:MAG: 3-phosphoserine/phosphohydroxythreonine transaminase [Deltaproteobacteria bacterium]|nr:3-phosphoserine/phosphohydroxythreonine transaminase [Deltaproteobacteria bacterium]